MHLSAAATALCLTALVDTAMASSETTVNNAIIAHGLLMGIAFAFLFPFGATLIKFPTFLGKWWVHASWQAIALVVALAGFGLGVWIAVTEDELVTSNGHAIIGIIVIGVLFLGQPLGGLVAHLMLKKKGSKTVGVVHRWIGRVFLILGVINGGLGLQLSANTTKGEIAYGVVAGFFFLLWFAVVVWSNFMDKPRRSQSLSSEEKRVVDAA